MSGVASMVLIAAASFAAAQTATPEDVALSFNPYLHSVPSADGYQPGMVIDSSNAALFSDYLPAGLLQLLGDGYTQLHTTPVMSVDLADSYRQATLDHLNSTRLGAQTGELTGYVAGRPFPAVPDPQDPRAAERIAWNARRGYAVGDTMRMDPFYWTYRDLDSNKQERRLAFNFYFLNYMGRVDQTPKPVLEPNPAGIYSASYLLALKPFDVRNTQLLIVRYADDLKRDDSWMYLGVTRRVRRLATGQTTDAYLGSDLMIEDFAGYNARISDYQWRYTGPVDVFLPFYQHDELPRYADDLPPEEDDYRFVAFGGQGGCFPEVRWQLRRAYRVEATPVEPTHPLSRRVLYFDAQTFTIPYADIYDRAGNHWKTLIIGQAHPDYYARRGMPGAGVAFFDAFTMVDLQGRHCTTGQIRTEPNSPAVRPDMFTVQHLRAVGK